VGAVADLAPWEHRATWPPDVRHVAAAREFVAGHLVQHQLDHEVDILRLVVSELATNAVVHARSPFVVTMARVDHTLVLAVSDESLDLPRDSLRPSTRRQRGRGLNIVEHLSSQWGVRPEQGGKTVWARFALEA
jgi:anti-sigma regulatory factor (Ser/Thr protein kinase)